MPSPQVVSALVCEDVRIERNGKHLLIGVYPSDIVMGQVPGFLGLMFWIQLGYLEKREQAFEFKASLAGDDLLSGKFTLTPQGEVDRATIPLGQFPIEVVRVGDLKVDVRPEGGRWKNAITIPVRRGPSATAAQPPSEQSPPVSQQ